MKQTYSELEDKIKQLEEDKAKLVEAIRFACAPDMWISNGECDEMFEYKYIEWYQDVLEEIVNEVLRDE